MSPWLYVRRVKPSSLLLALGVGIAQAIGGCNDRADATVRRGWASALLVEEAPQLLSVERVAALDVPTLVERVNPTVVSVSANQPSYIQGPGAPIRRAVGSGFIISTDGLVLTNAHVVEGAADVRVELLDGRALAADVIGEDKKLDVALLELRGVSGLPAVQFGSSDDLRVGEQVVAIGNPFGLGHTVTIGVVSAKQRALGIGPFDQLIQTDASINPGSSGGPLFNAAGRVIGINTIMHAQGQGIGFAIPIDDVRAILPQLHAYGHVNRGAMGIAFQEISYELSRALALPTPAGALVTDVEPQGPSSRAGITPGDVIRAFNRQPVNRASDLARALGMTKPGEIVEVELSRRGETRKVRMALAASAADPEGDSRGARPHVSARFGKLGAQVSDEPGGGARVEEVDPYGPAAGELEVGDVVVEANGEKVRRGQDLVKQAERRDLKRPILLRLRRDGEALYVALPCR